MEKKKESVKKKINVDLVNLEIYSKVVIKKNEYIEESDDNFKSDDDITCYQIEKNDLTDEEVKLALMVKQTKALWTIRKILMFFFIVFILGMLGMCLYIASFFS